MSVEEAKDAVLMSATNWVRPYAALDRLNRHVKGYTFHNSTGDLGASLVKFLAKTANVPESSISFQGAAGAWTKTTGELHLDGGDPKQYSTDEYQSKPEETDVTRHVYAHEYTHAIDGPNHEISYSPEWKDAYQKEIVARKALSAHGRTRPSEGFAEFGRLVFTSGKSLEEIAKEYPLCTAVWKKHNLG